MLWVVWLLVCKRSEVVDFGVWEWKWGCCMAFLGDMVLRAMVECVCREELCWLIA
jgi:hypothetical protein